jgi:hypothetical protein
MKREDDPTAERSARLRQGVSHCPAVAAIHTAEAHLKSGDPDNPTLCCTQKAELWLPLEPVWASLEDRCPDQASGRSHAVGPGAYVHVGRMWGPLCPKITPPARILGPACLQFPASPQASQ